MKGGGQLRVDMLVSVEMPDEIWFEDYLKTISELVKIIKPVGPDQQVPLVWLVKKAFLKTEFLLFL